MRRIFQFFEDWSDWFELVPPAFVVALIAFVLIVGRWE